MDVPTSSLDGKGLYNALKILILLGFFVKENETSLQARRKTWQYPLDRQSSGSPPNPRKPQAAALQQACRKISAVGIKWPYRVV